MSPTPVSTAPGGDRAAAARVAGAGLAVALVLVALGLLVSGGHVEWFAKFGATSPITSLARDVLGGDDLAVPFDEGHDGTEFWLLARDPLLLHPEVAATYSDSPVYRSQRILYPALAAPWRLGGERALFWGMLVTNVAVVFAGGYLTARLAQEVGVDAGVGLAFVVNPVVLLSLMMDLADALAVCLLVAVVLAVRRRRLGWAGVAAAAAVVAKEPSMLSVLALGALTTGLTWRQRTLLVAPAVAAALVWTGYVRWRFGQPFASYSQFTAVPFSGLVESYRLGWSPTGRWGDALVALAVIGVSAWVVLRWFRLRTVELTACLPLALLVPFLHSMVLHLSINSLRVLGPAFTLLVVDVAAERRSLNAAGATAVAAPS